MQGLVDDTVALVASAYMRRYRNPNLLLRISKRFSELAARGIIEYENEGREDYIVPRTLLVNDENDCSWYPRIANVFTGSDWLTFGVRAETSSTFASFYSLIDDNHECTLSVSCCWNGHKYFYTHSGKFRDHPWIYRRLYSEVFELVTRERRAAGL